MVRRAYAKINLGLHVLRKREDKFHDLETIFHRVNLYDDVRIESAAASISISGEGLPVPLNERNLCWKAVELLRTEIGQRKGANIHLTKRIPVGAGLGGGSSDAAAVLTALPQLWNTPVDAATLARVGLSLGSDVPFFLHNRSAYAEGRGERLNFVSISLPYWILLVTPDIHISTAWAYGQLSDRRPVNTRLTKLYDGATCTVAAVSLLMENDFEGIVFPAYPEIAGLKQELMTHGAAYALLSGSGSSVFGLFNKEAGAKRAEEKFRQRYPVSLTPPQFIPSL